MDQATHNSLIIKELKEKAKLNDEQAILRLKKINALISGYDVNLQTPDKETFIYIVPTDPTAQFACRIASTRCEVEYTRQKDSKIVLVGLKETFYMDRHNNPKFFWEKDKKYIASPRTEILPVKILDQQIKVNKDCGANVKILPITPKSKISYELKVDDKIYHYHMIYMKNGMICENVIASTQRDLSRFISEEKYIENLFGDKLEKNIDDVRSLS